MTKIMFKNIISKYFIILLIITSCISFASGDVSLMDQAKSFFDEVETNTSTLSGRLIQIFLLIGILGIAPALLIMVTSFIRISVVFTMIRTALGLQQSPSNQVMNTLALFLTFFIMKPVFENAYTEGLAPMINKNMSEEEAIPKIIKPFKKFMLVNTKIKDLNLFADISNTTISDNQNDIPIHIVLPAFMISELHKAFMLGFLIFLPFLIIDIVVSSILMAMGMIMMPPMMISLPIKIIFFVLIDGWYLLSSTLVKSFAN